MGVRRLLKALTLLVVTAVVVPVATTGTVLASFLFLPLPASLPDARASIDSKVSRVFDANGTEIAQFRKFEITQPVQQSDIPKVLKLAVLAGEDRRYYEHGGVDLRGTVRALWTDLRHGGTVQGGSTITQQYVKNTYVGSERSISRKVREAVLASQLDRTYSKDEILFKYLDQVYLGEGAYGVGAAAQTYFHKRVNDLTLSEAATLAGLIPAPSYYEPRGNPDGAENKRQIILKNMLEAKFITEAEYQAALPFRVYYGVPVAPGTPITNVFPRDRQRWTYPFFVDYVRSYIEARYGEDALYNKGLQIYTTIDPAMQQAAEEEIARTLAGTSRPIEMALVSVEPGSGFVKAMVGGRDFYAQDKKAQVNLALAGFQPGSTFKPFVLAEALEQGVSPDKTYSGRNNLQIGDKEFHNFGNESYGTLNLRQATTKSVNTVYVQLLQDVGVEKTMDLARRLGDARSVYQDGTHGLSVALGAVDASPLDMASSYGVWANRGLRANPTPIVRINDNDGHAVEDNSKPKTTRVMREELADTMNEVLQGPLGPGGTAGGKGIGRPAAGKTGTTQDNWNAWFVGYTPQLSTAVWMGHNDGNHTLGNVKGVRAVTGGTWPARTWQAYMKRALDGAPVVPFNQPAPITEVVDDAKRAARKGFDVGNRRRPAAPDDGGDLSQELPPPTATAPTTSTSTTSTTLVGF
ncbi:MAG: pbpF 2 [Actinomycetia bacterium]|nr:pbpF 2 [Actinomycetes bacterium]